MLLTYTQVSKLHKGFVNNSSADIKSSKIQLINIAKSGGFLGRLLRSLLKTGLPLMENILRPLAKSVLIQLGLTATAAATADPAIHEKKFGSCNSTLRIKNYIMKIIKFLGESGFMIKGVSLTIKMKQKKRSEDFFVC